MSKVECNALVCGFNDNAICKKRSIDVEGLFAKNKVATFCSSFKNPKACNLLHYEFAKEMDFTSNVLVSCSANNCIYNNEYYCEKKELQIGKSNAVYRSETECESFKLK